MTVPWGPQRYVLLASFIVVIIIFGYYSSLPVLIRHPAAINDIGTTAWEQDEGKSNTRQPPSRTLVIASTAEEDTSWAITNFLEELSNTSLRLAIYNVDDPNAPYAVPKNKGHEVMAYLTFVIDHYDDLSPVNLFMHSHQITWHNNDLLLSDSVAIVKQLRSERVLRHGYMNLRCHHDPGCGAEPHINLSTTELDINVPEAIIMKGAWAELFPNETVPDALSQPCCAQFAVSADRIRETSLERYISYRNWLLNTELEDRLSGRIWEYLWQILFAGVNEFCPVEHVCYCDGYGVCLGSKDEYYEYFDIRKELWDLKRRLNDQVTKNGLATFGGLTSEEQQEAEKKVEELTVELDRRRLEALERGLDPQKRQQELGPEHSILRM